MARRRKRRKKNSGLRDAISLITSVALLVIAVLMVVFVVFYIKNNSFLDIFGKKAETEAAESTEETESDEETEIADDRIGLCTLEDGEIVYVMDAEEAEKHDESEILEIVSDDADKSSDSQKETASSNTTGDKALDSKLAAAAEASAKKAAKRYYLINSWLDFDNNLYYFDAEGHACRDSYTEGAFIFDYSDEGILEKISYNSNYRENTDSSQADFPGLIQTKTLWTYMDSSKTLGDYTAIMFKKTTDSLSHVLGGDTSPQYASPYAYELIGGRIYYLAVPQGSKYLSSSSSSDSSSSGNASSDTTSNGTDYDTVNGGSSSNSSGTENISAASSGSSSGKSGSDIALKNIVGKVFCMTPGADYRDIWAEGAYGFKAITDSQDKIVIYYYDGTQIRRSTSSKKDENMVVFSEDASYTVDTSSGKAYLTLSSGQKVTIESGSFKAGNFTYSLSSEGEILSVAEKTTVSTGGYTYSIENGDSFGTKMARVVRKDKSGNSAVISSEFSGTTSNLHFDYGTSCMIAEYVDANGNGGLLKISLSGDVDLMEDAKSTGGKDVLYAIDGGNAIYKTTEDGETVFKKARINATTPIAVAVEPVTTSDDDKDDDEPPTETAASSASGNASNANVETGAAPSNKSNSSQSSGDNDTSVGAAPGGSN